MACLEVVHPIEQEYVDLNIKFQVIIYNTNPVIVFKKIPHFGHIRPCPLDLPEIFFSFITFLFETYLII